MNYYMSKLDSTLPELLNILKTVKGVLKKETCPILLVQSSRMFKRMIRRIWMLSLKQINLLGASRKT
jgi:hypothetical protein